MISKISWSVQLYDPDTGLPYISNINLFLKILFILNFFYRRPTLPDQDLEWPQYDDNSKKYLSFSNEIKIKENILSERFQFWDNFIEKWEKQAVNGIVTLKNKKDELYFFNFINFRTI